MYDVNNCADQGESWLQDPLINNYWLINNLLVNNYYLPVNFLLAFCFDLWNTLNNEVIISLHTWVIIKLWMYM